MAVYPVFERLDIGPVVRLRPKPLRQTRFILDVHLGKLARDLRMLGFDCAYRPDWRDAAIIDRSLADGRIILTRDVGILKQSRVTHGYWLGTATGTAGQAVYALHGVQWSARTRGRGGGR